MPTKAMSDDPTRCIVEFRIPASHGVDVAWLAGEFNGWSTEECPLACQPDGSLAVTVELDRGRSYRFRYYLGDGLWVNDDAADAYVENAFGGADSVVTLPVPTSTPTAKGSVGDGPGPQRARAVVQAEQGGPPSVTG